MTTLGNANPATMWGPGDLAAPNDPQNASAWCDHAEDDSCRGCDPEAYIDGSDGAD